MAPPPPPLSAIHELPPLLSTLNPYSSHLSPSHHLCPPPYPLPFVEFSFLAKRLVGVFSTVVTFRTVCHLSLSLSHLSLALSLTFWPSHPPSSSCGEGLLEPGIEAGMEAFKCLCGLCLCEVYHWPKPLNQSLCLLSLFLLYVAWLWAPLHHWTKCLPGHSTGKSVDSCCHHLLINLSEVPWKCCYPPQNNVAVKWLCDVFWPIFIFYYCFSSFVICQTDERLSDASLFNQHPAIYRQMAGMEVNSLKMLIL